MLGDSARDLRRARRTALLLLVGPLAQLWSRFRGDEGPRERGHAEAAEPEFARASEEFHQKLAGLEELFWTVEVGPGGRMSLVHLNTEPPRRRGGGPGIGDAGADAVARPDRVDPHNEGVVHWTWSRGTPRREGDHLLFDGITTITERRDLTAQREILLQREREQRATLEEVHRTRDDFIALAGHELRTPLTVIQGYAEQLLDDSTIGPDQRAQLEIVVRRARSMSDLIDDLFDLAKLDAPLNSIAFAPVLLDAVVEESAHTLEPRARERGVTVHVSTTPAEVLGDAARLRRMCDNVIDNAVKYSPSGGDVTVNVLRVGNEVAVQVADHGIGVPPEELSRIFERLYRASNVVDNRYPGTGLGLSIVLATASSHGGTAYVSNAVEGGTVVTIRLPLA